MFPKYKEIQIPILAELRARGGQASPSELYPTLARYFSLSKEALEERTPDAKGRSELKWNNMVRWARNDLRKAGYLISPRRGVWEITEAGVLYIDGIRNDPVVVKNNTLSDFESPDYKSNKRNVRVIDLETFNKSLVEASEIGDCGEKYVVKVEVEKLLDLGLEQLAKQVNQVSLENVAAGYDVLSFDEGGNEIYIEVKSTKSTYSSFELTSNELMVAKEKCESYWIYRVENALSAQDIRIAQKYHNPAKMIEEGSLKLTPSSYRVSLGE